LACDSQEESHLSGSFKGELPAVMNEVQAEHETVVITKRDKPVAKLVLLDTGTGEIYNGAVTGDTVSPADFPLKNGDNVTPRPFRPFRFG
jgi:antitoxin (DNA-binding transcriptional repressor) of toxin-antitoxin stability system